MAIGDIAAVVINAIIELVGSAVFGTKKPSKKQNLAFWVVAFLFVAFLFNLLLGTASIAFAIIVTITPKISIVKALVNL